MKKICIIYYASTDGGVERLTDLAHRQGFSIAKTLTDSAATRPGQGAGWKALCCAVTKRAAQMVIVPSIAVLGAGLDDLVAFIGRLVAGKMGLVAVDDGIDTTTPEGSAWMAAVASLQDYKTAVRRQTARAGQLRAREAGVHCGRPALPAATIEKARLLISSGHGIRPTARSLGISPARVAAEKAAMRAMMPPSACGKSAPANTDPRASPQQLVHPHAERSGDAPNYQHRGVSDAPLNARDIGPI